MFPAQYYFLKLRLVLRRGDRRKRDFYRSTCPGLFGYPDCRPEFFGAFRQVVAQGTKAGVEKKQISIEVPLLNKGKVEIIKLGEALGVPYALTWSCYKGGVRPCNKCESCFYRAKGFKEAGFSDPALSK